MLSLLLTLASLLPLESAFGQTNPRAQFDDQHLRLLVEQRSLDSHAHHQYRRDDATNQIRHRADSSYPAFFNCALHGGHGDPGFVVYTNNTLFFDKGLPYDGVVTTTECRPPFNGDKHGTWGGYFDWEANITDTPTNWSAALFLVGTNSAFNPVEICPDAQRVCDVAIRRPQQFKPSPGAGFLWTVKATNSGALLQSGVGIADTNGLVKLPAINVPRDPERVVLQVSLPPGLTVIRTNASQVLLSAYLLAGFNHQLQRSTNLVSWQDLGPSVAGSNAVVTVPRNAGPAHEFYRLRISP